MSKVSQSLRDRLLKQRGSRTSGNPNLIDNKEIGEKGIVVRMLPIVSEDASIAEEYLSYYCRDLNTGTSSPAAFGLPCPIDDALREIYTGGGQEAKEHAKNYVNMQREFWMPVIVRGDEGTADNPNIRVFRCKASIFDKIVDWMTDEDLDDMTDVNAGRDIKVRKTGKGIETRWGVDRLDPSPLAEDEALSAAIVKSANSFRVNAHFYRFNLETLENIYEGLLGDPMPERYREALGDKGEVAPTITQKSVSDEVAELLDRTAAESGESSAPLPSTGRCSFVDDDDATLQGDIVGVDDEEEGNILVVEDGGDPEEPWSLPFTDVTMLSPKKTAKKRASKKRGEASTTIRDGLTA